MQLRTAAHSQRQAGQQQRAVSSGWRDASGLKGNMDSKGDGVESRRDRKA